MQLYVYSILNALQMYMCISLSTNISNILYVMASQSSEFCVPTIFEKEKKKKKKKITNPFLFYYHFGFLGEEEWN